ncbi:MAG: hypothetical protein WC225_04405 [Acholeplasmataceae bacterium]|nr:hypothetical protein [Acholeplasmataceae bacterium]
MNFKKLEEKLNPILAKHGLTIYSIRTKKEFGEKIVEILLDTETMNINDLEAIHLEFVAQLDDDDIDPDYYLELSSLGAERPLKTAEEVEKAIDKYIYLEADIYRGVGFLRAFNEGVIELEINQKGRIRKIQIPYATVKNMRTSVKV